ncbi:MAG TPA: TonB-dependent receptor [Bacteroidales bacterium]|nr:TonB-dependent receptor [Bacteroidales bacterium]
MKKMLSAILLLTFAAGISVAQTIEITRPDTINFEEVVVTGTPVKVNRNNIPMAVSVVNLRTTAIGDESALLPLLSGRVPGLFVTERGITGFGVSGGAAGQITLRGIGGNPTTGVLILIDGHPQFMGIFGHPLADSYVASDVDRVEVIRGPASILYGSNAMGGVINIITRKQLQEGFHANARVMYGSHNTQKYMVNGGFMKNGFSVFASVNHDQTDGHRPNSDFSITNGYIKVNYAINPHLRAGADFSIAGFGTTDPGPDTANAAAGNTIDITRGYWSVSFDNDYEKYSGSAKFFYNFGEHDISDGFHSNDANYGINVFEAFRLFAGNSITFGIDHMNYGGKASNKNFDISIVDTSLTETGVYGFIQQTIFGDLTANAGLRSQYHEISGNEWIPSGGLAYKPTPFNTFKLNVSKGFRSPTIRELFLWNHNTGLSPERILNYEAGFSQSLFKRSLSIEITGFMVKGNNLIVAGEMGKLFNTGKINNKGIEIAVEALPVKNLSLSASYSFIDMKTPVYATPEHQLYISGQFRLGNYTLSAGLHQVGGLDTDPSAVVNTSESYTLVNAKISCKVGKYLGLFISGDNLLDQTYETNHYYTMPGALVFGGIHVKI